ncbi:hypothetical protein NE237_007433 [Protea cynaroides]|uniref:Uncharacterized protein n=1 Tax=Protea cynaroides TaxID=273540 RepID=A0A9Q0KQ56_9MAGN|nr:hypothetical protein NE237_007433 [Protea cynaroides]
MKSDEEILDEEERNVLTTFNGNARPGEAPGSSVIKPTFLLHHHHYLSLLSRSPHIRLLFLQLGLCSILFHAYNRTGNQRKGYTKRRVGRVVSGQIAVRHVICQNAISSQFL